MEEGMEMDRGRLKAELTELWKSCSENVVSEETALSGCEGLVMYEDPLFGVSDAGDEIYRIFQQQDVVGENFMLPSEWLPGAVSVISFFLPFTERVRRSNRGKPEETSPEWLHARVEGQKCLNAYTEKLKAYFDGKGVRNCVPAIDPRFGVRFTELPEDDPEGVHAASNWSERHVAYASGIGTFCLTRGLISAKGVAGRYGSIIIDAKVQPDTRPYSGIYDYCSMCGACIKRCPAGAISLAHGKNQKLCREWMNLTETRYAPRYGCGKCQVGVPCESGIPKQIPGNSRQK